MDLHEENELQSPGRDSIELESGHKYFIKVHASKVSADQDIANVPLLKRKCIMQSDRVTSSFTRKYNQKSCRIGKAIMKAAKENNCTPWDLPFIPASKQLEYRECSLKELQQMADGWNTNLRVEESVDCLEACEDATYTYSIQMAAVTHYGDGHCKPLQRQLKERNFTQLFHFPSNLETFLMLSPTVPDYEMHLDMLTSLQPCQNFIKNSIIVTLQPQNTPVHIVHMQRKVSFTSQVATFGNEENFELLKVLIL